MAGFSITGRIGVETRRADTGELIPEESGWTDNIVVDVGLKELAALIAREKETAPFKIAVGTGTTTPAATDTSLAAEVHRGKATSIKRTGATVEFKYFLDTGTANGSTLAEAGLLHNDVLIDRSLITAAAKDSNKTVTVTVALTVQR